ncbi:MAG: 50S ribosomal protein L32 [Chloroflexota bacterium]
MGALPKKKISHSAQGKRRSHHRLELPSMMACPQCRALKLTHHVCPNCGTYKGEQVLQIKPRKSEG